MYYDWTQSQATPQNHKTRAMRYTKDLRVVLSLPFESWQLVWNLRSVNISTSGLLCGLKVVDDSSAQRAHELDALLDAEPGVHIQIESKYDALYAPSLAATVVRKARRPWGLELALTFTSDHEELGLLLANLESTTSVPPSTWN